MEVKPGYKQTEVGVIPEDWGVGLLGMRASFKTGPFGSTLHQSDYVDGGIPVINPMHINDGQLTPSPTMSVSEEAARRLVDFRMKQGEVVIGRRGDMGRCAVVDEEHAGWVCGTGSMLIRPRLDCPDFLQRVLSSSIAVKAIEDASVGSTMINLNQATLSRLKIQTPPLEEQRAVATALSDMDALLDGLDRLIAKKRAIKHAAMQQLLTGQTRLPGFSGEWEVKRLGDSLLANPDYGINAPAVMYSAELPTYIRITDISDDGRFMPSPKVSVSSPFSNDYILQDGDIVFARTGASVGKSYRYRVEDGPLVFAGFLIRVRPDPGILLSSFLAAFVTSRPYWNWVQFMSMRSGQPGINGNEYASLPLRLPCIEEQIVIAEVLTDMDAEITALETRRTKTHSLKQAMTQDLLTGRTRLL